METARKTGQVVMLDPVGRPKTNKQAIAARLADLNGKSIGFLYNGGYSGEFAFNYIRQRLTQTYHFGKTLYRVKPNTCAPAPATMIEEFASTCDVAIVGMGVWGSCTSAAVRDAVELEKRGIPTVMISQDIFEAASKGQARVLGMPDLPLVIVCQIRPGVSKEQLERNSEDAFKQTIRGLTTPAPQAPRQ